MLNHTRPAAMAQLKLAQKIHPPILSSFGWLDDEPEDEPAPTEYEQYHGGIW